MTEEHLRRPPPTDKSWIKMEGTRRRSGRRSDQGDLAPAFSNLHGTRWIEAVRSSPELTDAEREALAAQRFASCDLVYEPTPEHHCPVNDYGHWMEHWNDSPGTVRACTCGQNWVAYRRPQPEGGQYYTGVYWRREGRFARWRRERKTRRNQP